jgi:cytochrome c oxidase subunit 2
MISSSRRQALGGALAVAAAALVRPGRSQDAGEPRQIEIVAHRFAYEPSEVALEVGERVVVTFRSLDFEHGMSIPALATRLDIVPGRAARLALQPRAPGVIEFLCDNFCGSGHEDMHGRFVVSD